MPVFPPHDGDAAVVVGAKKPPVVVVVVGACVVAESPPIGAGAGQPSASTFGITPPPGPAQVASVHIS